MLIELRQARISYQDYRMLLLNVAGLRVFGRRDECFKCGAARAPPESQAPHAEGAGGGTHSQSSFPSTGGVSRCAAVRSNDIRLVRRDEI